MTSRRAGRSIALAPFAAPTFRPKRDCGASSRGRRLQSFKFVRQTLIGPYIVDFLYREARFIVEVDGATHSEDHEIA
jgi:hypothetical protein